MGEEGCAGGKDHGHGPDHQRGVRDSGEFQPLKLNHELQGDAEECADQQQRPLVAGEARPFDDGKQANTGEDKAVEDVMADAKAREGYLAEKEAGAPAASGERARHVAEAPANGAAVLGARCMHRGRRTLSVERGHLNWMTFRTDRRTDCTSLIRGRHPTLMQRFP